MTRKECNDPIVAALLTLHKDLEKIRKIEAQLDKKVSSIYDGIFKSQEGRR